MKRQPFCFLKIGLMQRLFPIFSFYWRLQPFPICQYWPKIYSFILVTILWLTFTPWSVVGFGKALYWFSLLYYFNQRHITRSFITCYTFKAFVRIILSTNIRVLNKSRCFITSNSFTLCSFSAEVNFALNITGPLKLLQSTTVVWCSLWRIDMSIRSLYTMRVTPTAIIQFVSINVSGFYSFDKHPRHEKKRLVSMCNCQPLKGKQNTLAQFLAFIFWNRFNIWPTEAQL